MAINMNLLTFEAPKDRVLAEAELLEKIHKSIYEYVGVLTVVQVIGILEICKGEVIDRQRND